jgi:hypothetical protein
MKFPPLGLAGSCVAAAAVATLLAGCSVADLRGNGQAASRSTAHGARVWVDPETRVSWSGSRATETGFDREKGLSETPVEVVANHVHVDPIVRAEPERVHSDTTPVSPPRPVEVPWSGSTERAAADLENDDSDSDGTASPRPTLLPGRVHDVTLPGESPYPDGVQPGPCCLRFPKKCAEFMASAKVEGTLASRAVDSLRLRATPFGKPIR